MRGEGAVTRRKVVSKRDGRRDSRTSYCGSGSRARKMARRVLRSLSAQQARARCRTCEAKRCDDKGWWVGGGGKGACMQAPCTRLVQGVARSVGRRATRRHVCMYSSCLATGWEVRKRPDAGVGRPDAKPEPTDGVGMGFGKQQADGGTTRQCTGQEARGSTGVRPGQDVTT